MSQEAISDNDHTRSIAITAKGSKFRHMVCVEVRLVDGTRMERTVEAGHGN